MLAALVAAATSLEHPDQWTRRNLTLVFMLSMDIRASTHYQCRWSNCYAVHTMFYSPAMGPVPFTLASEA